MSPKPLFELTETLIKKYCNEKTFSKGEDYIDAVSTLLRGDELSVKVHGSMCEPYRVNITLNEKNWKNGSCSCPSENYPCKHLVATLLKIVREGIDSIEPPFEESLKSLDADTLRTLLINIVEQNPELIDDIQIDLIKPQEKIDIKETLPNFSALKRKMIKTLNSEFNNWDNSFYYIIEEIKTLFNQVQPFLEAEDGKTALKVLEALTEPFLTETSEFLDYAQDSYGYLLDDLEMLWIEALLIVQLSKTEKEYWFERISKWQESEEWAFQALMQVVQHGWSYPLLDAALRCQEMVMSCDEDEDEEIKDKIAAIGLKILKRKQQWDQCLALAKLACIDQEYASILIQKKQFQECQKFIKQTFKCPVTILQLAREFYESEQPQMAFELISNATSFIDSGINMNLELIRWSRELAFEHNQLEVGIQIGTKILQNNPTLEDYASLKKGAKERWEKIQPQLVQSLQTSSKYNLDGPIEILLHDKMFDLAIKLSERADEAFFPKFIIDQVLEERPEWALKKCEELAITAINTASSCGYEEAAELLDKGYTAAKLTRKTEVWNTKIRQIIDHHKRKRNLIPLLQRLLSIHS